jgi:hypothetical protein
MRWSITQMCLYKNFLAFAVKLNFFSHLLEEEGRFLDGMKDVHDITMACVVRFGKDVLVLSIS